MGEMAQPNLDLSRAAERRLDDHLDAIAGALGHADRTPGRRRASLHRPAAAGCAQEHRAAGGPRGATTGAGGPPVAPSPGRPGRVARRGGAAGRPRACAAGHRAPRPDPPPDHRRHRLPEKGPALGGCGTPILRATRQAGWLPGRGDARGRQRAGQPADRLPARPARGLGGRSGAAGQGGRTGGGRVPDQAADRASRRSTKRPPTACRPGWCWRMPATAATPTSGPASPRRDPRYVVGVQASTSLWPPRERGRRRRSPGAAAGGRRAASGVVPGTSRSRGGGAGRRSAGGGVAHRRLARGRPGRAVLTVRRRPGAAGPSGRPAARGPPGGMAADRVARGRERGHQVLAVHRARGDRAQGEPVAAAKARRRIERDSRELEREIGLGHDEGRGRRGFHHHAALCLAACGFLVAERGRFPPRAAVRPRSTPGARPTPRLPAARRAWRRGAA